MPGPYIASKSKQRGSPMRTITALFVGLGSIGTRHLKNLTNLCADRGWTLQADALRSDLSRPLRDGVAALLHAQYTDLADAPAHYDMVFITNPTSLHADALTRVRGRGGALFIEKPIFSADQTGLDLADCLPAGQKAYVAAPMRWCGVMLALKDRLPGLHPYCARVICSSYLPDWRPGVDYRTVYSAHKAMGGGVTIDLIHEWDYLVELFGVPESCTISRAPTPTSKSTPTICRCISPDTPHCWPRCISITLAADTGAASSFSAMTAAIWPTLARAR